MFFKNPFKGQLHLSNDAIKIAAKRFGMVGSAALRRESDSAILASSAIRAGARLDFPQKFVAIMNHEICEIKGDIIWIFGKPGDGKSTMADQMAMENAYRGGKTFMVSAYNDHPFIPRDEIFEGMAELSSESVRDRIDDHSPPFIHMKTISVWADPIEAENGMRRMIQGWIPSESDLIILDEFSWQISGNDIRDLVEGVRGSGRRAIIVSQVESDVPEGLMDPYADCVVRMGPVRNGVLSGTISSPEIDGPFFKPVVNTYCTTSIPDHISRVIDNLAKYDPKAPYSARLDAVSKSCGFRDWHAAQGRKLNRS